MKKSRNVLSGLILIVLGFLFLLTSVFRIDFWDLFLPLLFISIGVWLILRSRGEIGQQDSFKILGDFNMQGNWEVSDAVYNVGIGDVILDMTKAKIPSQETRIQIHGFIGDVKVILPSTVKVSLHSSGFLTEARVMDQKNERFFGSVRLSEAGYEKAAKRIYLDTAFFIGDITVSRS